MGVSSPSRRSLRYAVGVVLVLVLSRTTPGVQVCEFRTVGCPENFRDTTIIVPTRVTTMAADVYLCQPSWVIEGVQGSGKPPSIMFVIDNSGSMRNGQGSEPAHDPQGNRYTVTKALLDSLYLKRPDAEVGVAVFTNVLYFDPGSPEYFSSYFSKLPTTVDNVPDQAYLRLLKLDSLYVDPTHPTGRRGIDIIKDVLQTRTTNNVVDLVYRPQAFNPSGYTNINVGFMGAKAAMANAVNPRENQFVIFLSDGEPQGDMQAGLPPNDFTNGTNMPTTFTVFFTSNLQGPANLQLMTQNIRANNYSSSNPRSEIWAMQAQYNNLLTLLMNSVLQTILTITKGTPSSLVVNSVSPVTTSDSVFVFGNRFPLQQDSSFFHYEIMYHLTDQKTGRQFDSLITVDFSVKRSDALTPNKNVDIACVDSFVYTVTLSASTPTAMENGTNGRFTFHRDNTSGSLTAYFTVGGTAVNTADYQSIADSIVFSDGQANVTLDITPIADNVTETSETVVLSLQSARTGRTVNYNVGAPSGGTVTIQDFTVFASVTAPTATISESGGSANFIITRNDTGGACIVYFTLTGGAVVGTDYLSIPDSAVIPAGQKTVNVTVTGIPDALKEPNETIILTILGTKAGRTLKYAPGSPASATISITDYAVFLTVGTPIPTMSENGGVGNFIIRRNDPAGALTVYFTLGGDAASGSDYIAVPDSIVMADGQAVDTVTVAAIQDFTLELDETVVINLDSSRAGRTVKYGVGMPGNAGIIIIDYTSLVTVTAMTENFSENGGSGSFVLRRSNAAGEYTVYFKFEGTATAGQDYETVADSVVLTSGVQVATVTLKGLRDYVADPGETVVLTVETTRAGRTVKYGLGNPSTDTITITNFASLVSVNAPAATLSENGGTASFIIRRTDSVGVCTIYFTMGGNASNGADYQTVEDSVVLANGQKTDTVTVTAIKDFNLEPNELVVLTIDGARQDRVLRYEVGTPAADTVTIVEYTVQVTVKGPASPILEKGGTGNFVIKRTDAAGDMAVYFTVSGSATAGADYPAIADSVYLASGQDSSVVTITGIWDFVQESDETVIVTIDASRADRTVRYGVGSPSADTAVIADFTVFATVTASPSSMSENGDTARFIIRRNEGSGAATIYFTIGGTAIADSDYVAVVDSVDMADGQVTADVVIAGIRDYHIEPDETVVLTISPARDGRTLRYSVGTPAGATIRIKNYIEPFKLVPHAVNNPMRMGASPVPPYVLGLPNINKNTLGQVVTEGVVIAAEMSPRIKEQVGLNGTLSIYDVVKNPVVEDLPMAYDDATKRLYFVWDGRNSNGRNVAAGTYMAMIKITDTLNKTQTKRIPIGVKR